LQSVPVETLTPSTAEEDIIRTYYAGANSFIPKPLTFEGVVKVLKIIGSHWFNIVQLPDWENVG
jgi:DNA-binding response OmpR family regulator